MANVAISLGCVLLTILLNLIRLKLTATAELKIEPYSLLSIHTDLFMVALSILLAGYLILPVNSRGKLFFPLFTWIILLLGFFGVLAVQGQDWAAFASSLSATLIIPNLLGLAMVAWAVSAAKED